MPAAQTLVQGPVVQSIVSLTSSLVVKMLKAQYSSKIDILLSKKDLINL